MMGNKKAAAAADPDLPPFPWALDYLWSFFLEFSMGLTSNGMGPVMAGWRDVQDWCAAMRLDLEPWEKKALVRLSNLRASVQSESKPKSTGKT
jgi:hypothetical protein